MKRILLLFIALPMILFGAIGKVLDQGKFYEMRDSTFILWTSRIHSDSTLDTIAIINKDGIWIPYGEFSDSLWAKIIRGEYGVWDSLLVDTIKSYLKGEADSSIISDTAHYAETLLGSTWDTLGAYLDTNTTRIDTATYAENSLDSSWASITIGDSLRIKVLGDTTIFEALGGAFMDLSDWTLLLQSGPAYLDELLPATNDSSTSKIGADSMPFGEIYTTNLTINGDLIRTEIPFAIRLLTTGSYIYSNVSSNLTDGTHNKGIGVYPIYFNINDGDSIHFDSCYYAYQWNWDGTPNGTDTLIWERIVTTFYTRSNLLANTQTYDYEYVYDTIIGSDGNGTNNYMQTLNFGGITDSITIMQIGFHVIIVDVNAATSVDCGIGTPILYGRQIRR